MKRKQRASLETPTEITGVLSPSVSLFCVCTCGARIPSLASVVSNLLSARARSE